MSFDPGLVYDIVSAQATLFGSLSYDQKVRDERFMQSFAKAATHVLGEIRDDPTELTEYKELCAFAAPIVEGRFTIDDIIKHKRKRKRDHVEEEPRQEELVKAREILEFIERAVRIEALSTLAANVNTFAELMWLIDAS